MARAFMITNPVASRTSPSAERTVAGLLERAGWDVEMASTRTAGHARELAAQARDGGADLVAVFGGDGTTVQVAAELSGTGIPLGLIPGGTGNLLAGNLRVPVDPVAAARVLLAGRQRKIDLGRVERDEGPQYFAVACGAGYDALVMGRTEAAAKRRWGIGAYLATSFRQASEMVPTPYRITIDGRVVDTEATLVLVANCSEVIPPRLRFGQSIAPDDGVLDVVMLRANGLTQGLVALSHVVRGHRAGTSGATMFRYDRGREVRIVTEVPRPVQLDGDLHGETPLTATAVPGALTVLVP